MTPSSSPELGTFVERLAAIEYRISCTSRTGSFGRLFEVIDTLAGLLRLGLSFVWARMRRLARRTLANASPHSTCSARSTNARMSGLTCVVGMSSRSIPEFTLILFPIYRFSPVPVISNGRAGKPIFMGFQWPKRYLGHLRMSSMKSMTSCAYALLIHKELTGMRLRHSTMIRHLTAETSALRDEQLQ